ncbi:unnamed protein product [Periconia digitata]|uniref:Secreted protein n=1 Tax=Periconia digitata TaxID=1303443 RepID=A0A9W4UQ52_9PLEO|nr:unnamed protein product [Periconia digitata]
MSCCLPLLMFLFLGCCVPVFLESEPSRCRFMASGEGSLVEGTRTNHLVWLALQLLDPPPYRTETDGSLGSALE